MNKYYQNKWMVYHKIHEMHDIDGKTPSQIAPYIGIDTRTVKKILLMSVAGYENYLEELSHRSKKLAPYESFVKDRLEKCPEASAAQMKDWLLEFYPELTGLCDKTVYNFVLHVRETYNIPRLFENRHYRMVEELDYGQQAQVDFGEYNMTDIEGHRRKVHFIALVLARSRYKFTLFQDHPFTTEEVCVAHDMAFSYIGGYPAEVVYDQDKLLLVRENAGDLVLTSTFGSYVADKPFKLRFCRKSDPQSKGKVENVVKYIKYNFLRGRRYHGIPVLNVQALEWLDRTANGKVHCTTRLIPQQQWQTEKDFLHPTCGLYEPSAKGHSYHVRKDNTIGYKGCFYTLPDDTYKGNQTIVHAEEQGQELVIFNLYDQEIARHKISLIKGVLVSNSNHYRDTSIRITDKIHQVSQHFSDVEKAIVYLEQMQKTVPRYMRDQLTILDRCCKQYSLSDLDLALEYCIKNAIYRAKDLEGVIKHITSPIEALVPENVPSALSRHKIIPQKSDIADYKQILK